MPSNLQESPYTIAQTATRSDRGSPWKPQTATRSGRGSSWKPQTATRSGCGSPWKPQTATRLYRTEAKR